MIPNFKNPSSRMRAPTGIAWNAIAAGNYGMGKVINFEEQVVKRQGKDAKQAITMRFMRRWYFRNRRAMQERDEKCKHQEMPQDEQTDE